MAFNRLYHPVTRKPLVDKSIQDETSFNKYFESIEGSTISTSKSKNLLTIKEDSTLSFDDYVIPGREYIVYVKCDNEEGCTLDLSGGEPPVYINSLNGKSNIHLEYTEICVISLIAFTHNLCYSRVLYMPVQQSILCDHSTVNCSGRCEQCGAQITEPFEHEDGNGDGYCDICGDQMT